jgi:hypothetical protein
MPATAAAPTAAIVSATNGVFFRLHFVGPGGGRGPLAAKNEHPESANTRPPAITAARMR